MRRAVFPFQKGVLRRLAVFAVVFASVTSQAEHSLSDETLSRRALLWTETKTWKDTALKSKQFSCHRISKYKSFLYVECFGLSGKQLMRALSSLHGVKDVARDHRMLPVQHALPEQPYRPQSSVSSKVAQSSCQLSETCSNGRSKFWAQERMDGDLMFAELNRMLLPSNKTKVAVIDTGFDMSQASQMADENKIKTSAGWWGAGDPYSDEFGHGTGVAGLIGGKDGIGLAPDANLTVYRVTEHGQTSSQSTSANLMMSVMKACDEGNEVINLSWGGDDDEFGKFEAEENSKAFFDELAAKGCLVVKSAGNKAKRLQRSGMKLDDALLRVEANEVSGKIATFSSNGEVSAPGAGVFTLKSSQHNTTGSETSCGGHKGAFVDGTSFAAPLTSAVATQVLSVLKVSDAFQVMDGPARVATLNRVVAASATENGVNALRAVMMAEMLIEKAEFPIGDVAGIEKDFQERNKVYCEQKIASCMNVSSCAAKRKCSQDARKHVAICRPPQASVVSDLARLADATRSNELALALLNQNSALSAQKKQEQQLRFWNRLHADWTKEGKGNAGKVMPFEQALGVLPALVASDVGSETEQALGDFLTSTQFKSRMERDMLAGSEHDLKRVTDVLKDAHSRMPKKKFLELVQNAVKSNTQIDSRTKTLSTEGVVSMARLLNSLIDDPKFESSHAELIALERSLAEQTAKTALSRPIGYMEHLDGLYVRNADLLWKSYSEASSGKISPNIASLPLQYLIKFPDVLPKSLRADFNLKMIHAQQKALEDPSVRLGGLDATLGENARMNLIRIAKTKSPDEQAALRDEYWKISASSPSAKQMVSALPDVSEPFSPAAWSELQKNPIYSGNVVQERSQTIAKKLIADPDQWKPMLGRGKKITLQKLVSILGQDPSSAALIPAMSNSAMSQALHNISTPTWEISQIYDMSSDCEAMNYLLREASLTAKLKADPTFMKNLSRLSDSMDKHADRYANYGPQLKTSISAFMARP